MSFDAYSVAVKLTLKDEVTQKLKTLGLTFDKLDKDSKSINERFESLSQKLDKIQQTGQKLFASGIAGMGLMGYIVKPAEEYAHQLNIMNMQGIKHQKIAEAIAAAWKTTSTVITSTATGNLKTIIDLRSIFGNMDEAVKYLPEIARIQAILKSSSNSGVRDDAENLGFSLAKALDIRGAASNTAEFNKQANMMMKVMTLTQSRILPSDYQMLFKYARQATPGLSDQFLYQVLPEVMLAMKGKAGGGGQGGFGTSLAAGNRFFVQGIMSKVALANMSALGLIPTNARMVRTATTGTMLSGGVKGASLFQSNPLEWIDTYLLPAIHKKYGNNLTNNQLTMIISHLMKGSSQTAQFEVLELIALSKQIKRDERLLSMVKPAGTAYQMALSNDPSRVFGAFAAQWNNLRTALGMTVIPVLLPLMMRLTQILNHWAIEIRRYPNLFKMLSVGFGELALSLTGIGGILMGGAFLGRGLINAFKIFRFAVLALTVPLGEIVVPILGITALFYGLYKVVKMFEPFVKAWTHSLTPGSIVQTSATVFDDLFLGGATSPIVVHHATYLDGKQIAKSVTAHQAMHAAQQPSHGSTTNGHMSLLPVMLNSF